MVQRVGRKARRREAVSGYQKKAGEGLRGNLARMSESHGAIMPDGVFLHGVGEKVGRAGKAGFEGEWRKIGLHIWRRSDDREGTR